VNNLPALAHLVTTHAADPARLALLREPRTDVVRERATGADHFEAELGPFRHYHRRLEVADSGAITETIDFELAVPFWWVAFALPMRWTLKRPGRPNRRPWWAPPEVLDVRASTVLGLLCSIALIDGYVGSMLTQTITYAAADFGEDRQAQGTTLAAVRAGVLLALVLAARADRVGRRRLVATSAAGACIGAAAGALAPNLAWLGATQLLATGCAGALGLLIAIVSAEEMPAGARAYGFSLITMAASLGAGMCVWVLPAADVGRDGWRLVFVVPLLGLGVAVAVGRRLPETRRFARPHVDAPLAGHGARLGLLAVAGFLGALFVAPAFQFQNDFLRRERGFSAARISLFTIITSTPAAIGVVAGGRWADVHGRKVIGAIGVVGGTLAAVLMFATSGWSLWAITIAGSIVGAMVIPALGVYRPELFPTGLRGRASGIIQAVTLAGSATGLVLVGTLVDRWDSYVRPIALVALGPLLLAVLVLTKFPETARRELEDLNPEDRMPG
jgi:MFS family permease